MAALFPMAAYADHGHKHGHKHGHHDGHHDGNNDDGMTTDPNGLTITAGLEAKTGTARGGNTGATRVRPTATGAMLVRAMDIMPVRTSASRQLMDGIPVHIMARGISQTDQ